MEADRILALVGGAAIGGLHDRGAAAGADYELSVSVGVGLDPARQAGQLAGFVIIFGFRLEALGDAALVVGGGGLDERVGLGRFRNTGRAVEDEGRRDLRLVEDQLRLQQPQLKADGPQRPAGSSERWGG